MSYSWQTLEDVLHDFDSVSITNKATGSKNDFSVPLAVCEYNKRKQNLAKTISGDNFPVRNCGRGNLIRRIENQYASGRKYAELARDIREVLPFGFSNELIEEEWKQPYCDSENSNSKSSDQSPLSNTSSPAVSSSTNISPIMVRYENGKPSNYFECDQYEDEYEKAEPLFEEHSFPVLSPSGSKQLSSLHEEEETEVEAIDSKPKIENNTIFKKPQPPKKCRNAFLLGLQNKSSPEFNSVNNLKNPEALPHTFMYKKEEFPPLQ